MLLVYSTKSLGVAHLYTAPNHFCIISDYQRPLTTVASQAPKKVGKGGEAKAKRGERKRHRHEAENDEDEEDGGEEKTGPIADVDVDTIANMLEVWH
jgi:hypothetical protein